MIQNGGGESSELYIIVQGNMSQRNWDAAREELKHFLSLPRSISVESRARYYLGQACYFTGRLGDALFEFLAVQDTFPEECANWIRATLDAMVEKR
jgi:TolA-binding protein